MEEQTKHRTLIVANLTASTPFLLQEVTRMATERPTKFSLLVPNVDPGKASDWSLPTADEANRRAAGRHVKGRRRRGRVRVDQARSSPAALRRRADLDTS